MKRALITISLMTALLLGSPTARAAETSLGIGLGYVKAKQVDATILFTADFRFHLSRRFALAPEVSYWKKSAASIGISAAVKDLQFGVNALMVLHPTRDVRIFGGGGGGLHDVTGSVASSDFSVDNATTKGGLDLLGGIDVKAADALSFFLAARYDWVLNVGGAEPRSLDQAKFYGGFRVNF
jgi:opacity protein-like surface antigen